MLKCWLFCEKYSGITERRNDRLWVKGKIKRSAKKSLGVI